MYIIIVGVYWKGGGGGGDISLSFWVGVRGEMRCFFGIILNCHCEITMPHAKHIWEAVKAQWLERRSRDRRAPAM